MIIDGYMFLLQPHYPPEGTMSSINAEDVITSTKLRNLILSKEKELHDINEYRIQTLEQVTNSLVDKRGN